MSNADRRVVCSGRKLSCDVARVVMLYLSVMLLSILFVFENLEDSLGVALPCICRLCGASAFIELDFARLALSETKIV